MLMRIIGLIGKILFVIIVISTLSGIIYYNRDNYYIAYEKLLIRTGIDKPCSQPILYYINQFDEKFGQDRKEFEENLLKASTIWNNAIGKNLFQYSTTNPKTPDNSRKELQINLIYDSRQDVTEKLKVIDSTIDNNTESYTTLKSRLDKSKIDLENKKQKVDNLIENYNIQKNYYEKELANSNADNKISQDEYYLLETKRKELNIQAQEIDRVNKELNSMITEFNSLVQRINLLGKELNKKINTYNDISLTNGPEFQEGEYISDNSGQRINIYQYSDYTKLIRVLAHEFGHAIGIDHVNDKDAIMYAYNNNSKIELKEADILALKKVCIVK